MPSFCSHTHFSGHWGRHLSETEEVAWTRVCMITTRMNVLKCSKGHFTRRLSPISFKKTRKRRRLRKNWSITTSKIVLKSRGITIDKEELRVFHMEVPMKGKSIKCMERCSLRLSCFKECSVLLKGITSQYRSWTDSGLRRWERTKEGLEWCQPTFSSQCRKGLVSDSPRTIRGTCFLTLLKVWTKARAITAAFTSASARLINSSMFSQRSFTCQN